MNEVVIGVLLSAFFAWSGWVSISVLNILRKIDMILYKVEGCNSKIEGCFERNKLL